jgi:RNA polymerase sigma factor (sigma-70 family)
MKTVNFDEIRQGDPETMTILLEEIAPVIKSIASRFEVEPESILQEVFIHLIRDPGRTARLAEEGALQSWCRVLSRNVAMHQLRRSRNKRLFDVSTDESTEKLPVTPAQDLDQAIQNAELVGQLLSKVDEIDQKIITLRYVDELTFEEIGSVLALAPETVRYRANRAMAKLRYTVRRSIVSDKSEIR